MIKYETDSRIVKEGQIFVAIKGHTVDGHDFINDAINKGAIKIITEKEIDIDFPHEVVDNTAEYLNNKLQEEYSSEFKNMKFIGVTGTNGKTTTCFLTYQLLKELGTKVAYIGTIGFYLNGEQTDLPNTTPDILTLYKLIQEAKEQGSDYIVMEVSSHALDLKRVAGLNFNVGAYTNLTQDHLDYHKTMEEYKIAKKIILNYLTHDGIMVINSDDQYADEFRAQKNITVGKNGDLKIINVDYYADSTEIKFNYNEKEYIVRTNLIGDFNVYNYLMSLAILKALGFSLIEIIEKTEYIKAPPGRCEVIKVNGSFAVIDYAHTPDAVEKVINTYVKLNVGKVITVLGCGGDRDPKKRPIMGEIATNLSDYVIFTSDNPRTEDPKAILDDIVQGVNKDNYQTVVDRKEAIIKGLKMLNLNDFLLVLGKGHEDYQIIGRTKNHFSDQEIINDFIND